MMKCLVEGGIKPFWSKIRERDMHSNDERYEVNPDKFYEVGQKEYMRFGFTSELPDNCCVKIQAIGLPILSAAKGYKIIYMRRDPEAIKESYIKAFGPKNWPYSNWPDHYWQLLDGVKGIMGVRRDVELLELQYEDVLSDPTGSMERIKAMGVPINVNRAAGVIDPKWNRHATIHSIATG